MPLPAYQKSDRLRVLVLSHLYPSASDPFAGVFVKEQAEALAEHADVTVVVPRYGEASQSSGGRAEVVEVSIARTPPRSALAVTAAVRPYRSAVLRLTRTSSRPFDLIHAHYGFPDGVVGRLVGSALRVPVVITLHGSDFEHQIARPLAGRLLGRYLAGADRVVAVAPHIADGMRTAFGQSESVVFLPNGYNETEIGVHPARTPRYFLFVGALSERKDPDILLEAYARVAERLPFDLVFVGDGPRRGELEQRVAARGLAERVRFEGRRPHAEVDGYLAQAAALVLPSRREGMPIIVNEALASGTPVVASRLPGTEWQLRDERFGFLVPPRDTASLSAALRRVAEADWDYASIAQDCGIPSWREYAVSLLKLYDESLSDTPRV